VTTHKPRIAASALSLVIVADQGKVANGRIAADAAILPFFSEQVA
jgi:hypothetical protein